MTPKERVLAAINHKLPDKMPTDLGTTNCTSIVIQAYTRLKKHFKVEKPDVLLFDSFQIMKVDEEILELLEVDTRAVPGKPHLYAKTVINENCYIDHFGIKFAKPENGLYFDIVQSPLADMETLEEVKEYQWPDPKNPAVVEGLKEEALRLHKENRYAIVGDIINSGIWEASQNMRGFQNFLIDIMVNKDIAHYVLEKMVEFQKGRQVEYLNAVGEYLDVVFVGDDLATSQNTVMSLDIFREMVKPYLKEYYSFIKKRTKAKLMYHSCGAITPFLDDLIEIGVDILNPIQVNAAGMNTKELKKRFGDRLCFWGGIDAHNVMPKGTPRDVQEEVRRRIADLGPEGYVCCENHNIQADIPTENIIALYKSAKSVML